MLSLRDMAYASRGCVCAVCGNESILLTMSLHFASSCRPTRQEGIALLRLQMLIGYTMLSQLLMYLAEAKPDPAVDNLVGMLPHNVKIDVCLHMVMIADRSSC